MAIFVGAVVALTVVAGVTLTGLLWWAFRDMRFDSDVCARSNVEIVREAGWGNTRRVRELLDDGVSPDVADSNANTPLGCAIPRNRVDVVQVLLDRDADPDLATGADGYRELPLDLARKTGGRTMLVPLLDHGADPDKGSLLLWAIEVGNREWAELALQHHADPNRLARLATPNEFQFAPRPSGWESDDLPLIRVLMRFEGPERDWWVKRLLDAGADPSGRPGRRPLVAAAGGMDTTGFDLLVDRGGRLDPPFDDNGPTTVGDRALATASASGPTELVQRLLQAGASPNADPSHSPLLLATLTNRTDVASALLDVGADPNAGTLDAWDLLGYGTQVRSAEVQRVAIDRIDPLGSTPRQYVVPPLTAAVANGNQSLVRSLLVHGADTNKPAFGDITPMYIASIVCNTGIAADLLAAGADPARARAAPPPRSATSTTTSAPPGSPPGSTPLPPLPLPPPCDAVVALLPPL